MLPHALDSELGLTTSNYTFRSYFFLQLTSFCMLAACTCALDASIAALCQGLLASRLDKHLPLLHSHTPLSPSSVDPLGI